MIYRLAILVGSLALLLDASNASGLRASVAEVQQDANIPTDHEGAQRIANTLINAAKLRAESDRKETAAQVEKLRTEYKANEDPKLIAARAAHANKQVESTTNGEPDMHWGSIVKRYRPTGDCSGKASVITAHKFNGTCVNDAVGSGSTDYSCAQGNEQQNVALNYNFYSVPNCQGQPYYSSADYGWSGPKCKMVDSSSTNGAGAIPMMVARQCAKIDITAYTNQGGIVTYAYGYENPTCAGDVHAAETVSVKPFGGCELHIEYKDAQGNRVQYYDPSGTASFHYGSITSCAPNGKMAITAYSDPACRRPLFWGQANIENANMCYYESNLAGYARTVCVPPGGL